MHRLFFKVKEKIFRGGPVLSNYVLNYRVGIFLLNRLIKLRSFRKYRATEIENLTALLGLLDVPRSQHEGIISHYLFNNTWQHWKSLHYEQPRTFQKYWQLKGRETIEECYQDQQVIIFLYRHTALSNQHTSIIRFGFGFDSVSLGNISTKKFLIMNGQINLPKEVLDNPLAYPQIVRKDQLRRILTVLNKPESYTINYFFDGQEGAHFQKGQIDGLYYQLSTNLLRFLRPHTRLILVEPIFDLDGNVMIQFQEVPRYADFNEQLGYVQKYYSRTFISTLPTLNEYMIKCLLKNHHALKNSN